MKNTATSQLGRAGQTPAVINQWLAFWRKLRPHRGAVIGLTIMACLCLAALLAPLIAPHGPTEQFRDAVLLPPFWQEGGSLSFPLGTDDVGRDLFSRLIFGARLSLFIGAVVVGSSLLVGTVLGLFAAFSPKLVDDLIMRIMDILLVFPSLLLAVVVVGVMGPGLGNAMIAVAVVCVPSYTRLARAAAMAERNKDYVLASQGVGAGLFRIIFINVLPNCVSPLIVQATLGFAVAILDAAALGFLGLGAQPPTPEWGTMLAGALRYFYTAWWVVTFPGLLILVTVLAFNLLGDGLRDALDPKIQQP
ncbi:ABC transporter permease subunit [Sinorhizobium meliloti]|uniref:Dipeptide ABC transporter permease DppC n=1 Tax=Rhizobium meliloti TaxID=382 RepID=A0A2J0YUB3_RHIML|nr:dipeptide ABC transporter permease DppC [Sinorhizobium meliloti]